MLSYLFSYPQMSAVDAMKADTDAIIQSFCLVAIAEIFYKTWFVALLMALKHDKFTVFCGCSAGLAAHVAIAGFFGVTVSKLVPVGYLDFGAAILYVFFAYLFYQDYLEADPEADIIAAGKEEAAEDCEGAVEEDTGGAYGAVQKSSGKDVAISRNTKLFGACSMAMFIAEWGDRTQIAMLGAAASKPVIPVCIGSLAAFLLLTLSAVIVGGLLGNQTISEKMVHGTSAIAFVIFAVLAVRDGLSDFEQNNLGLEVPAH